MQEIYKSLCYIFNVCTLILCVYSLFVRTLVDPQVCPPASRGLNPLFLAFLIAILLLLLLELSEMGLNCGGGLLDLNRAQRRSGWHVWHGTGPVADVGV